MSSSVIPKSWRCFSLVHQKEVAGTKNGRWAQYSLLNRWVHPFFGGTGFFCWWVVTCCATSPQEPPTWRFIVSPVPFDATCAGTKECMKDLRTKKHIQQQGSRFKSLEEGTNIKSPKEKSSYTQKCRLVWNMLYVSSQEGSYRIVSDRLLNCHDSHCTNFTGSCLDQTTQQQWQGRWDQTTITNTSHWNPWGFLVTSRLKKTRFGWTYIAMLRKYIKFIILKTVTCIYRYISLSTFVHFSEFWWCSSFFVVIIYLNGSTPPPKPYKSSDLPAVSSTLSSMKIFIERLVTWKRNGVSPDAPKGSGYPSARFTPRGFKQSTVDGLDYVPSLKLTVCTCKWGPPGKKEIPNLETITF